MTPRRPSNEVLARRAIAAATKTRRSRPRHRADRGAKPTLRSPAGLALIATGLICMLAVHTDTRAVNVQTAGIIVTTLGLAWLWIPVRNKRALLRGQFDRTMRYLAWDPGKGNTVRCTLGELLESSGDEADNCAAQLSPEN